MTLTPSKKTIYRLPLLLLALLILILATWAGLIRLGWQLPAFPDPLLHNHGPLMVSAFFGTLIGLERAVAVGKNWAYLAPLSSGIGGLLLGSGISESTGILLLTLSSALMVLVFVSVLRRKWEAYLLVMALGAVALLVGNLLWLAGWQVFQFVSWWAGFLILTIAGERLELGRMINLSQLSKILFTISSLVYCSGLIVSLFSWSYGITITSAGMILLAAWLLRYDIARRTVKQSGLTRFIAICLLSGYAWLIVAGMIGIVYGGIPAGPIYDAMLHSIFLGFVFSMIFGHAPIIFPAILNFDIRYKPIFYLPLVLLHLTLVTRIAADLMGLVLLRKWSGLLNVLVVMLYFSIISPLMNAFNKGGR